MTTNTQLQRLTKATLVSRVEDLEDSLAMAQQALQQPVDPEEAVSQILVKMRNDGAGLILLMIVAGEVTFLMGRKARCLLDGALVGAGWGSGWRS